jgi:hypothetical protein
MKNLNLSTKYLKSKTTLNTKYSSNLFSKTRKYTLNDNTKNTFTEYSTNLFKPVEPSQHSDIKQYYLTYSKCQGRENFLIQNFGLKKFYVENLNRIFLLSNSIETNKISNPLVNLINTNFLRKERIYTKLKYSRTPGYDIVSGGAAVILAGFLGFLVSEKFGIELPDSGDFYYLWMYIVFLCFSVRPLLTLASKSQSVTSLFSLRHIINFYSTLVNLLFKVFKNFIK